MYPVANSGIIKNSCSSHFSFCYLLGRRLYQSAAVALILTVFLFFLAPSAYCQPNQQRIDSLTNLLPEVSDSAKVKLYLLLFKDIMYSDYEVATHYGEKALEIATKIDDKLQIAGSMMNVAVINQKKGNYEKAIEYYERGLEAFIVLNDSLGMAMCLGNAGGLYLRQAQCIPARDYFIRARQISEDINDSNGIAISTAGLGGTYRQLGQLDSAILYYTESAKLFLELEMPGDRATIVANMGLAFRSYGRHDQAMTCFQEALATHEQLDMKEAVARDNGHIGVSHLKQEQWEAALPFFEKSNEVYRAIGNKQGEARSLNGMAGVWKGKGQFFKAIDYYKRALRIKRQLPNLESLAETHEHLGETYREFGQLDSALFHLGEAMTIATGNGYITNQRTIAKKMAQTYQQSGDNAEAYAYERIYSRLTDSIFRDSDVAAMEVLRADFNASKVQLLEKETLAQQQRLEIEAGIGNRQKMLILILTLLICLLGMGMLWFKVRSAALLRKKILTEREKGLRALIEAEHQVREKVSRDLHDGLGQTLTSLRLRMHGVAERAITDREELVELDQLAGGAMEEVRTIAWLMVPPLLKERGLVSALDEMLAKSVDSDKLSYEFDHFGCETGIPELVEVSLYRTCQELVSNTIKHAQATSMHVQLIRNKQQLVLSVEDNGIGFDYADSVDIGLGLRNMKNRIEVLGGKLVVESISPHGQITKVRINLPDE